MKKSRQIDGKKTDCLSTNPKAEFSLLKLIPKDRKYISEKVLFVQGFESF
jgi:hypothetical protein